MSTKQEPVRPFPWGDLAEHAALIRERVKKWPLWKQQVSVSRSPKCYENFEIREVEDNEQT